MRTLDHSVGFSVRTLRIFRPMNEITFKLLNEYFFKNYLTGMIFVWKFESCMAVCCTQFLSMGISGTQIFHNSVATCMVGYLTITLMQIYWEIGEG